MLIYMLIFFVTQSRKSTDKSLVKNIIIIILQDIFPQMTLFQIVYITTYVNVQKMDCDHPLHQNIRDFPFIFFDSIFCFMTNDIIHADWTYHYRFIKRCRGFFWLSSSWHGVVDMNTKFFFWGHSTCFCVAFVKTTHWNYNFLCIFKVSRHSIIFPTLSQQSLYGFCLFLLQSKW